MNLYLIKQNVNRDWDTYDSAVVVADSPEEARLMHPSGDDSNWNDTDTWAEKIGQVDVIYLGKASVALSKGVVLASFKAG